VVFTPILIPFLDTKGILFSLYSFIGILLYFIEFAKFEVIFRQ